MAQWLTGTKLPNLGDTISLRHFSQTHIALGLYVLFVLICLKRDLSIFIRISSFGAFAIMIIVVTVLYVGIFALVNTEFVVHLFPSRGQADPENWSDIDSQVSKNSRDIFLVNEKFSPLAGVLCIGYFLHPVMIPIIRRNQNQGKNERDIVVGFILVFGTYVLMGVLGYFGFMGYYFRNHMARNLKGNAREPLTQNCILMFEESDPVGFFLRTVIILNCMSSFPILHHFFRDGIFKIFFRKTSSKKLEAEKDANAKNKLHI